MIIIIRLLFIDLFLSFLLYLLVLRTGSRPKQTEKGEQMLASDVNLWTKKRTNSTFLFGNLVKLRFVPNSSLLTKTSGHLLSSSYIPE